MRPQWCGRPGKDNASWVTIIIRLEGQSCELAYITIIQTMGKLIASPTGLYKNLLRQHITFFPADISIPVKWITVFNFNYHANTHRCSSFDQETWGTFGRRAASATSTAATDQIFSPRTSTGGSGPDPVPRSGQRPSVTPETGAILEDMVNRSRTIVKLHR